MRMFGAVYLPPNEQQALDVSVDSLTQCFPLHVACTVYIDVPLDQLESRWAQRARPSEASVSRELLANISKIALQPIWAMIVKIGV